MRLPAVLLVSCCLVSMAGARASVEASWQQTAPTPARSALGQMTQAERKNSRISVEFESSDSEAVSLGHEVERLWNGGQYDEALAQLGNLEARVGHVAIGNSWRKPVPTIENALWGSDVRIGNRDSLLDLAFDHGGNGDPIPVLFVALRHGHGPEYYSVCMSTDGGATWAETFTWVGSQVTSLDAGSLYTHFYVAYYAPGENAQQVRLRQFLCSDGLADEFSNGSMWVAPCTLDVGDTAKEVAYASGIAGWQFIATTVSDGSVLLRRGGTDGVSWYKSSTGITSGASRGLSCTYDLGGSYGVWMSYLDATDTLRITRAGYGPLAFAPFCGPSGRTCISGLFGHIICAYEDASTSPQRVRYAVSNDRGDTWTTGTLSDTGIAAEAPAVTAISSAFAVVFRQESSTPDLWYCWRADTGSWYLSDSFVDHEPYWSRPGIKYVGPGYGIVYLSDTSPVVRGAYFERTYWPAIAEQRRTQANSRTSLATVVRGRLVLPQAASHKPQAASLLDISGRSVLCLKPGANDVARLAPGVYFVREVQAQAHAVRKVIVAR